MSEAPLTPAAAEPRIKVRCASWREFAELYADDIASGGMYLSSASSLALLSTLDVVLQLPEATEISLRARVVQVVGAEQAEQLGKPAGMGLELMDIDAERKRQVVQLIEFARWQGASDDPKSSFARTLLELSPSLPPAEVGYRLSMLPGAPAKRPDSRPEFPAQTAAARAESAPIAKRSLTPPNLRASQPPAARSDSDRSPSLSGQTRARNDSDVVLSAVEPRRRVGSQQSLTAVNPQAPPPTAAKPTDQLKLKLVLSNVAHKHYDAALRVTAEMLEQNPGDLQALRWQAMCNARLALGRGDVDAAYGYYEHVLHYDPEQREARDFVRTQQREKKLNSLPFGRYFTNKKK